MMHMRVRVLHLQAKERIPKLWEKAIWPSPNFLAALNSELSDSECKVEEEMVIVRFFFVVRSSPRGVSL